MNGGKPQKLFCYTEDQHDKMQDPVKVAPLKVARFARMDAYSDPVAETQQQTQHSAPPPVTARTHLRNVVGHGSRWLGTGETW